MRTRLFPYVAFVVMLLPAFALPAAAQEAEPHDGAALMTAADVATQRSATPLQPVSEHGWASRSVDPRLRFAEPPSFEFDAFAAPAAPSPWRGAVRGGLIGAGAGTVAFAGLACAVLCFGPTEENLGLLILFYAPVVIGISGAIGALVGSAFPPKEPECVEVPQRTAAVPVEGR